MQGEQSSSHVINGTNEVAPTHAWQEHITKVVKGWNYDLAISRKSTVVFASSIIHN